MLQACLNGRRGRESHPGVPLTPAELAADAARAPAAGAAELHHGAGDDAWTVLDAALARGRDVRIGLEDTPLLPDGSPARDNAQLVAEAARRLPP
jgi:uncharacterized protein (DUF849 family)